jgi:pseudaminic acid cytidylyltransferase
MPEKGQRRAGKNKMNIAIIPARGGSKRIPRKNIKVFAGKPIIAYALEVAMRSKLFDHIIVSTEDQKIRNVAKQLGAEVPFYRPKKLSDDYTGTVPVIRHAIQECEALGWKSANVCCIYPCNPLLSIRSLLEGYKNLKKYPAKYVFPVAEFDSPIQRAIHRSASGLSRPFWPENAFKRTQDLTGACYDAGQFYWARSKTWKSKLNIHANSVTFIIPKCKVADIDTTEDWGLAEKLFKSYPNG